MEVRNFTNIIIVYSDADGSTLLHLICNGRLEHEKISFKED